MNRFILRWQLRRIDGRLSVLTARLARQAHGSAAADLLRLRIKRLTLRRSGLCAGVGQADAPTAPVSLSMRTTW